MILPSKDLLAQREFPDNYSKEIELGINYCKPGVKNKSKSKGLLLQYQFNTGRDYYTNQSSTPEHLNRAERFLGKIKIPILNKCNLKILTGFQYGFENFNFDIKNTTDGIIQSLSQEKYKNARFSIYFVKPLNNKFYISVVSSLEYNGGFEKFIDFRERFRTFRTIASFGIKKTEDKEYGLGLYYKDGFRRRSFYPFGFYYQTFSDKWGVESVIPVQVYGRRNFSEQSILLFGATYSAMEYSFDALHESETTIFEIRNQSINLLLKYEQQLSTWFWLNLEGGYQFQFPPQLELSESESNYSIEKIENGLIFKIGIFLSPPSKYLK